MAPLRNVLVNLVLFTPLIKSGHLESEIMYLKVSEDVISGQISTREHWNKTQQILKVPTDVNHKKTPPVNSMTKQPKGIQYSLPSTNSKGDSKKGEMKSTRHKHPVTTHEGARGKKQVEIRLTLKVGYPDRINVGDTYYPFKLKFGNS